MEIKEALTEDDVLKCRAVMLLLRPQIAPGDFVPLVMNMMSEGYRLAYLEEDGIAVSAVGFRYLQFLYNGRHFYIDDLSTLPATRHKGYAGMLLDYVVGLARENGYSSVTLDSGHHRFEAHKLYLNKGFNITAHHFVHSLK